MTFTAIARCPETGKLGVATATRSLAVGARVPHVTPHLGAVAIMAIADGRLGRTAMKLLEMGYKAPNVIDALVASEPNAEYRQLGVIDADGFAAARTGANNRDYAGHHVRDNFIALGNVLTGEHVLDAIEEGYNRTPDAGGQHGGQRSAAILVYAERSFARVDLRVDIHDEPVGELRRIFDLWSKAMEYYWGRQVDPRVKPLFEAVPDPKF
jgi:uncharacterized Ntn-hydrolase superfamily protein